MIALARHDAIRTLDALLRAAGWTGDRARLVEATPHLRDEMGPADFVQTLENLGLKVSALDGASAHQITAADCPCLFVPREGQPEIILDAGDTSFLFHQNSGPPTWVVRQRSRGWVVGVDLDTPSERSSPSGLGQILASFRGSFSLLVFVSFFISLLGFAAPLLIMIVYDRLIPTRAMDLLAALIFGMVGVLLVELALRILRSRSLAWMGARIEQQMGLALFQKLAVLPTEFIQNAPVDQQIGRLKQFEGLRGIFTGPIPTTVLEMPFVLLFLAAIWFLDPDIGLLITGLAIVFTIATAVVVPAQTRLNAQATADRAAVSALMLEAASHQRAIQRLGLGTRWLERSETAAQRSAASTRLARQFQLACQTFGQSLMILAGVGAVVLSTHSAMAGELSFGALIALISLTWKVLAPVQTLYANAYQIAGYVRSARQVRAFLGLTEERRRGPARSPFPRFQGAITCEGISYRYAAQSNPVLAGLSVSINVGELVVICGRNGAGKTTLLNLIGGLHLPTSGTLLIDGIDRRQIAVDELRDTIGFVPQIPHFFHGSILQNFQLVAATADEAEVAAALARFHLTEAIERLPEGLHTRLSEEVRRTLPKGTLQALSIARGLMRTKAFYLLDEPCSGLDTDHEAALLRHLETLRGRQTVVMVTDRPNHFDIADRLIFLDRGRIVINDTGEAGRRKMRAVYNSIAKA